MNERSLTALEQYDIILYENFHARASFICCTDIGKLLLYPFNGSKDKAELLFKLQSKRIESKTGFVDIPIMNKEGGFLSEDMYGNPFILKRWIEARECDNNSEADLVAACNALGIFHNCFYLSKDELKSEGQDIQGNNIKDSVIRHNRELNKIFRYIRGKTRKTEFEFMFSDSFDMFKKQADEVLRMLENTDYYETLSKQNDQIKFCHGDFSYHEVLFPENQVCIVHPEHTKRGIQIEDLANILRKTLEKNEWNISLGLSMIKAYDNVNNINSEEMDYLKLRLMYPEKFWKLANHYYNSNKTWIAGRLDTKLAKLIDQDKKKLLFLKEV